MDEEIVVRISREPGCGDLPAPAHMTDRASGLDLPAAIAEATTLEPGEFRMVPTGFCVEIPPGYEGQVRPRSGLAAKYGLGVVNSPGTIDADYRGTVHVILINWGPEPVTIHRGDRIAQLVVQRVPRVRVVEVDELGETGRQDGGFGHTGR